MKNGYIYILLSTLLFSTMEIALKLVTSQFHPIQLTFLRFLIGAIILSPLAIKNLKERKLSLTRDDFSFFILQGFLCIVVSMTFYQLAVVNGKASIVAVLFSCNPIFVIPFAYFIVKEKIYKHTIISLFISISGIIFIMNPLHMTSNPYGIIFSLLAATVFALHSVIGKTRSNRYGGIVQTCFSFFAGSFQMLILILISKISFISEWLAGSSLEVFSNIPILHGITLNNIPSLIYIGIFVTGLGYTFFFLAIEKTSATTSSLVFYIKPALAPVLALIILKESMAPTTIVGILLIIMVSLVTFISNSRQAKYTPVTSCEDSL